MKQYKNTVQTIQNTVNTITHITKTPTQLSKHTHITKPTHTHTHTLQNKLKQPQHKIHNKWNSHITFKCPQLLKEYEGSLPRSQQPFNGPYPNPYKSILMLYIPCIMFRIIRNRQNNVQCTKCHCLTLKSPN